MKGEDYCDYGLAVKLKECGFCEPCRFFYSCVDVADGRVSVGGDAHFAEDYNAGEAGGSPIAVSVCSMPSLYAATSELRKAVVVADSAEGLYDRLCEKWEYCDYELVSVIEDDGVFYAFLQSKKIKTYYD